MAVDDRFHFDLCRIWWVYSGDTILFFTGRVRLTGLLFFRYVRAQPSLLRKIGGGSLDKSSFNSSSVSLNSRSRASRVSLRKYQTEKLFSTSRPTPKNTVKYSFKNGNIKLRKWELLRIHLGRSRGFPSNQSLLSIRSPTILMDFPRFSNHPVTWN